MKLLIITQKVDRNDPILGFFHRWIEEFAKQCEFVTVICLEVGEFNFALNVKILSLEKERKRSRIRYITHFYKYIWQERKNYDVVLVHMNQEYVLLAGLFWRLFSKKIFMWRNHAKGNLSTRIAVLLSNKMFCTSPHSFTARFKK
ncbi:MAG: glycosyltransferase, partial [Patescibacteria group bacterium]|nr:glycosyltransferase [Patescibacteria group bacterium]